MKTIRLFILILLLPTIFSSCAATYKSSCLDMAEGMAQAEITCPAGKIYSFASSPEQEGYVSNSLLASLYGNGSLPKECESWLDFAVFLSTRQHPCELTVVLCSSHTAAIDTSRLFCRRLDSLKVQYGKEYADYIDRARVVVYGNHVIFAVSSDSENAVKTAKSML